MSYGLNNNNDTNVINISIADQTLVNDNANHPELETLSHDTNRVIEEKAAFELPNEDQIIDNQWAM